MQNPSGTPHLSPELVDVHELLRVVHDLIAEHEDSPRHGDLAPEELPTAPRDELFAEEESKAGRGFVAGCRFANYLLDFFGSVFR